MASNYQRSLYREYETLHLKHDKLVIEHNLAKEELSWFKTEYYIEVAERIKLSKQNQELRKEVARLQAKLNLDSNNSSLPVSKTPIHKNKRIPNSRKVSEQKKGGQKGHQKSSLEPFATEEINEIIDHIPNSCPHCGGEVEKTGTYNAKQETEYLFVVLKKEHRFHTCSCKTCGKTSCETIPTHLKEANQYGANLQTLIVGLMNIANVPMNKISRIIEGLSQKELHISEGYICKLQKRVAKQLEGFETELKKACTELEILYWDDTVIDISKNRACLRFYGDERLALFCAHPQKNKQGLEEDGILSSLSKDTTVMHDHNKINYNKQYSFKNAECCVHLLRDLEKIGENSHHHWCERMKELIVQTNEKRKEWIEKERECFEDDRIQTFFESYTEILREAVEEANRDEKSYYSKEEKNLIKRLVKYKDNYFAWVVDFRIPFSNNLSERGLRGVKSKMKISGQFTNIQRARDYARIRSYIETCRRNGINEMEALSRVLENRAYTLKDMMRNDT